MGASASHQMQDRRQWSLTDPGFWVNVSLSLAMLGVAFGLFQSAFEWAWWQIARPERQYHILVSLLFVLLCAYRLFREKHAIRFAGKNLLATGIVCLACTAYLLNQFYLQLNALSLALFLLFAFGLLGHFVSSRTWRSCLLPLLLTVLVLPFEGYLDIFLGFPMRLLSAEAAVEMLRFIGLHSVSSDTVLLIDNRAAIVDIDCSGIRGFWIGSVFFCAITWVERYQMNLRWLLIALFAALMLFFGNVARIVVLVLLDLVYNQTQIAQQVHESLGLISFAFALFISWQLLRAYGSRHASEIIVENRVEVTTRSAASQHGTGLSLTTLVLLALLTVFSALQSEEPAYKRSASTPVNGFILPVEQFQPSDLNLLEQQFFVNNAAHAKKYSTSVELDGVEYEASVLIVLSRNWKAQHTPENCYLAQGYKIVSSQTRRSSIDADSFPSRSMALVKSGANTDALQAFNSDYWFQSVGVTTANLSHRVFAQLRSPSEPWVMASVLWRDGVPDAARKQLLLNIRNTIRMEMNSHG